MAGMFEHGQRPENPWPMVSDLALGLFGSSNEEFLKRHEDVMRAVRDPSRMFNFPDPRQYVSESNEPMQFDEALGNVFGTGVIPASIAGIFVGPKGIRNLGKYQELIEAVNKRHDLEKALGGIPEGAKRRQYLWDRLRPFWLDAPDRVPRMEIPDYNATIAPNALTGELIQSSNLPPGAVPSFDVVYSGKLGDVMPKHPGGLFTAYPHFRDIDVKVVPSIDVGGKTNWAGYWDETVPPHGEIGLTRYPEMAYGQARHPLFHEITHAVQSEEGMARGGYGYLSPERTAQLKEMVDAYNVKDQALLDKLRSLEDEFLDEEENFLRREQLHRVRKAVLEKHKKDKDLLMNDAYLEAAGEAEARAVETRLYRDLLLPDFGGDIAPESAFNPDVSDLHVFFKK